ncbi:MAG: TonB-dependent receptor plug domain-containing protein [Terrimonas sp.]|nr:TonB-dependent receptor plug domain-containing protein [Terrimonas sp.]
MKNVLILLLLVFCYGAKAQNKDQSTDTTVTFTVYGNCEMCKARIEEAAKGKGVRSGTWEIDTKIFTLVYDPRQTQPEKVQARIVEAGHDTEFRKAKDYVYKGLPECCLYRDPNTHHDPAAEKTVAGVVLEVDAKGNFRPLEGASILLDGTAKGVATNSNGFFTILPEKENSVINISYAGYQTKSIDIKPGQHLNIILNAARELQEVKIVSGRKATSVAAASVLRTQVMSEKELFKAACCNLSESFETNPSVDVAYNDGVTGSKQIQLLGLSGNYTQLTIENLPGPRGIATQWGLNYIPGTWVESIQLTKGVGSVANGFESMAGQINIEMKKPENAEQLYANVYVNNMGKTDVNLNLAKHVGKKWSTALLLHNAYFENKKVDFNKDGFRDLPTGNLFTLMNRWKFDNNNGLLGQFGVRILWDDKTGGEKGFDPATDKLTTDRYGLGIHTNRYEAFGKIGYVFPAKRYKSFGLQLSGFRHEQQSYFGLTQYDAHQTNFYANLIYQSIIGNTNHKFRTGLSLVSDKYDELLNSSGFYRKEVVAGAFFEYTYSFLKKFDLILGLRGDDNNLYGAFLTPRLHLRYQPAEKTVIRLNAGRGQRTANILAENASVLVSARQLNILNAGNGKAYGLQPEVAWSEGISIDQRFRVLGKNGSVGLDYFRTDFQHQVVVDLDQSAREVNFYNLEGPSYSNSFQAELNYEVFKKMDIRLAYRLFDVKTTYHGELLERPLVAKNRAFANWAYEISGWKFDYTVSFNGTKRIPSTLDNPAPYQLEERSPSYVLMNAQITKTIGSKFPIDIYVGGENLGNYYQRRLIIAPDQPFGSYFDATLVWGPVSGRLFYAGLRLKIK